MQCRRNSNGLLATLLVMLLLMPATLLRADEQRPSSIDETPGDSPAALPPAQEMPAVPEPATAPERDMPPVALSLLGHDIQWGEFQRLYWTAGQAVAGLATPTPVLVAAGTKPGPTLCLTGAVHGDEVNGVEIIRRLMFNLDKDALSGVVVGVPIVNMHGFIRASRYLPDRRDLNRFFPGDPRGSAASRIAHSFFNDVIRHCDRLIDIHTGSFHRTNLTQLRSDLYKPAVAAFSQMFQDITVLHSTGAVGTLRRAAVEAGIPTVTLEAGEPLRLQLREVEHSVQGIHAVMHHLGMIDDRPDSDEPQTVYYKSVWLRGDQTGVFLSLAKLGQEVVKGEVLGTVTDPITNLKSTIRSTVNGQIIGMALNQMVMPGFAAYHIGINGQGKTPAPVLAAPALTGGEQLPTSNTTGSGIEPQTLQPGANRTDQQEQDEHPE